jgi:hypothetical protein
MMSFRWGVFALTLCGVLFGSLVSSKALAQRGGGGSSRISIDPYVSVSSTKAIKADAKDKSKENETIKQRTTYGVRANVTLLGRFFKFQLGLGQNQLATTQKQSEVKDEFGEIDLQSDLNMSTEEPDKEIKIVETQRIGTASFVLDPSFSIFIMRAKAGVRATQRLFSKEESGQEKVEFEGPITYKPLASAGAGVRLGRTMYFMAEYGFYFYKFPETEPFEREVSVSYGVSF